MNANRKYSAFLINVGSCSDRFCSAYGPPFTVERLFARAGSIDLLSGVDLVATDDTLARTGEIKDLLSAHDLKAVSVVPDHFTKPEFKQGAFSSTDARIRAQAIEATTRAMDFAAEVGCDLVGVWPGQDGYDYAFQADYLTERDRLADGIRQACRHNPAITVAVEYKLKEPRTHNYVNTVGTTALLVQEIAEANCGVVLDVGHALLAYESPAESVALLHRHGGLLRHIHINDNYRSWDDDMIVGSVRTHEYLEFFYWLRRTGYDGWVTIDQFPYREDGRDAVAESAAWMDALEGALDATDADEIAAVLARKDGVEASRLMRRMLFGDGRGAHGMERTCEPILASTSR